MEKGKADSEQLDMYLPPDKNNWTGRIDELDGTDGYRWHQVVQYLDLSKTASPEQNSHKKSFVFLGFCCDLGVRRNKGRIGSADGPKELRTALSNLAVHFDDSVQIFDAGDIVCVDDNLESEQALLGEHVNLLLKKGYFPILFGGGHEIAYGHYLGLAENQPSAHLGIINIDAHFDLRTFDKQGNSGTPFLQIAQDCQKNNRPFSYMALGIQPANNTQALFRTAEKFKVEYETAQNLSEKNRDEMRKNITDFISTKDAIYLTICLDVIAAPFAPGVSAPAINGLLPEMVFSLIDHILSSNKVTSCDIAELNPQYDIDSRTARLAAALVYNLVMGIAENR